MGKVRRGNRRSPDQRVVDGIREFYLGYLSRYLPMEAFDRVRADAVTETAMECFAQVRREAGASVAEKYDDVLLPFLDLMRRELRANSRKGDRPGWLSLDANTLLLEVYWHAAKLSAAVKNNDGPAIMEHSADVANMAMMVLDVCGGLALVETPADAPRCDCGVECQDKRDGCRYRTTAGVKPTGGDHA